MFTIAGVISLLKYNELLKKAAAVSLSSRGASQLPQDYSDYFLCLVCIYLSYISYMSSDPTNQ